MSVEAITWAYRQTGMGPTAKLLLITVADGANKEGVCFRGQAGLAEFCELSKRAVGNNLKKLEERGLIARTPRFRPNGSRTSDWMVLAPRGDRGGMMDLEPDGYPETVNALLEVPPSAPGSSPKRGIGDAEKGEEPSTTGTSGGDQNRQTLSSFTEEGFSFLETETIEGTTETTETETKEGNGSRGGGKNRKNRKNAALATVDDVERLFALWVRETGRNPAAAKLTPTRRKRVEARLREYPVAHIEAAIRNVARSAWNRGENDRGRRYDDLELICRSGEKLEAYRDMVPRARRRTKADRVDDDVRDWLQKAKLERRKEQRI